MQIVNVVEQRVYITEEEIRRCLGLPLQDSTDKSLETIYQLADAVIAVSRDERKLCLIWRRTERKRQLSADITREAHASDQQQS